MADESSETPYLETIADSAGQCIRHVSMKTWIIRLPLLPDLYWQPGAVRYLWRERPVAAIALGSPYSMTAWAMMLSGKLLKIPILLWGHGLLGKESGIKWKVRKLFLQLASGQLLYGDYAKELLTAAGFCPQSLYVVYNSLNYDKQAEIFERISSDNIRAWRQELTVKEGEGLIAFTGRLQPVKRLDILVKAVAQLLTIGRRVHIALVGDGSEKQALADLAVSLGVADQLHFLGANYEEEYLGLVLRSSELCVVPSGAGLSVMHSLAFGTPVILHDRVEHHFPEWEAIEEGKTGFFYRFEDVDDLVDKIEQGIFPLPAKKRMEDNCRAMIRERYNPQFQTEMFVKSINHLCKTG